MKCRKNENPSEYEVRVCGIVYGLIYKITDISSNKVYIGQVKTITKSPLSLHQYFGSGKYLERCIRDHGEENFVKEYLCECNSQEELNQKEIEFISLYSSVVPNGMNIEKGGWYVKHPKPQEEYDHHSKMMIKFYQDHPEAREVARQRWLGRSHSAETRKKMSDTAKLNAQKTLEYWNFAGRTHSDETKQKLSLARRSKKIMNNKIVEIQVSSEEVEKKISEGWKLGRLPFSEETKMRMRKAHAMGPSKVNIGKGKYIMKDGIIKKVINIEEYLRDGWILGVPKGWGHANDKKA
jgi:group I intron endonuclease